jgi:uncharacterized protein with von Willebrand factor type A (vWA) domain
MKTETTNETKATPEAPGLLTRMIERLDRAMKEKAEKKATESSCCSSGGKDGKGGKCC